MATDDQTKAQFANFVQSARELECDEDEAHFEDQLTKIAGAPKPEKDSKE